MGLSPEQVFIASSFTWMVYNLILAAIPFLLSVILFRPHVKINLFWIIGFFIFIAFFPNTPYIFTDIMHLYVGSPTFTNLQSIIFAVGEYLLFIIFGAFIFVETYKRFESFVAHTQNRWDLRAFRVAVFLLLSVGVYLGRFYRFNSWDIIANPLNLLSTIRELLNLHSFYYVVLFTTLLMAVYYICEHLVIPSLRKKK